MFAICLLPIRKCVVLCGPMLRFQELRSCAGTCVIRRAFGGRVRGFGV